MAHRKSWWLVAIGAAIMSAFIVPYTFLTNIDAWYGSFLFWSVITILVIGINTVVSSWWRDR